MFIRILCLVLWLSFSLQVKAEEFKSPGQLASITILMIGDSTMATFAPPPKDRPDLTGWGQVFDEQFNGRVKIVNHAKSGRSAKSFITGGHWEQALKVKADFLIIQFGHNDSHKNEEKSTDAETDFRKYLRRYIEEARDVGMRPILVSPMTRRRFKDGKIWTTLRPYAEATLIVGKEKEVPVIDLHKSSVAFHNKLGEKGSDYFNPSATDRTHFTKRGAQDIAKLVIEEMKQKVPELSSYYK